MCDIMYACEFNYKLTHKELHIVVYHQPVTNMAIHTLEMPYFYIQNFYMMVIWNIFAHKTSK